MDLGAFHKLIAEYDHHVTVDVGTGDGLSVYRCARQNPQRFFIGIDANCRPLEKISEKIYRRPAKGGLTNVLFVQAAVEGLPPELDGIASEVQVELPWGSLLRGVVAGDELVMTNLRNICTPRARLSVILGLDAKQDRFEWERLGLSPISLEYVENVVKSKYRTAGFRIVRAEELSSADLPPLQSSWARKLHHSASRSFVRIIAVAE